MLKNITSLPMLAGSIVHDQIEKILKATRYGREIPIESSEEDIIQRFKRSRSESKNKAWEDSPKWKTNLFEHYYDEKPTDEKLFEIRDTMLNSIKGFYSSDSYRFIQTMSDRQWLSIEDLDSFDIDENKVWVKLDFAIRHGERIYIYDWKTGKIDKENEVQLAVYSLYAQQKWETDLKYLRLFDVYLKQQLPVKVKPTQAIIDSATELIRCSITDMKTLLDDPDQNTAVVDSFPMVSDDKEAYPCSYCNFKEICYQ